MDDGLNCIGYRQKK